MKEKRFPRKRFSLLPLLAVSITLIVYLPALQNQFTNWDDDIYILNNLYIKAFTWENVSFIFSKYFYGNYHPLTLITYMAEYAIAGEKPFLFHLINVLFHLANTLLVFIITRKLLSGTAAKSSGAALAASLLFGIHPLHVESVAWISETKDVLYTFFYLLTLKDYICYVSSPHHSPLRPLTLSLLFFILSLLSKGQAVTLAPVLVLVDYVMNRKWYSIQCLAEKIPFFVLSVIFGLIALDAQQTGQAIHLNENTSILSRMVFASYGFIQYILKTFIPFGLSAVYPYPQEAVFRYWICLPASLLLGGGILYFFRKKKEIIFGFLFFFITLLPVLQIIPVGNAVMADRYFYVPSIGIFICVVFLILKTGIRSDYTRNLFIAVALIFSVLTFARVKVWRTSATLWNDVISKYPVVPEALNNRATEKRLAGDVSGAIADYNRALEIRPEFELAWYNRGLAKYYSKDHRGAVSDFSHAIDLKPGYYDALSNRGMCLAILGNFKDAIRDLNVVVENNRNDPYAWFNRGLAIYQDNINGLKDPEIKKKNMEQVISDMTAAIGLKKDMGAACLYRGLALIETGNQEDGCRDLRNAMVMQVREASTHYKKYCE